MADTIFLNPGELSARTLRNAQTTIDDAASKAQSASASASSAYYYRDGLPYSLFGGDIVSQIASASSDIQEVQRQINAISKILASGPNELENVDKCRKNDLYSLWDRISEKVGEIADNVINGLVGFCTGLFVSGKVQTGVVCTVPAFTHFHMLSNVLTDFSHDLAEKLKEVDRKRLEEFYKTLVIGKNEPVQRGKIRYYRQDPGLCNRACETMAFSYLGIDVHPNSLHDKEYINYEFANKGVQTGYNSVLEAVDGPANVEVLGGYYKGNFDRAALDELVSNFEKDLGAGSYSPVMLHYDKGSKGNYKTHWILIIGKNEDGTYRAIGPGGTSEEKGFNVTISDSGVVSGTGFSGCNQGRTVAHIGQYHRTD